MTDLELINHYRKHGDASSISVLMDRYANQIVAFGLKQIRSHEDVRDFANDLYVKLAEKLKTAEVQDFKSWLYVFMRNMCYDQGRRKQLFEKFTEQQPKHKSYEIEEALQAKMDQVHLYEALEELPEKEAMVIRKIYLEEKNYQEVMVETGLTFNQLRGVRNRGTKRLREVLLASIS
jgi:RNA polymerase sigma-70 factor (ECF subfamily)